MRPTSRIHPRGGCLANVLLLLAVVCLIAAIVAGFTARAGFAELETQAKTFTDGTVPVQKMVAPGTSTMALKEGILGVVAMDGEEIDGKTYGFAAPMNPTVTITGADGTEVKFESMTAANPQGLVIDTPDLKLEFIGVAEIKAAGDYTVKIEKGGDPAAVRLGQISKESAEAFVKSGLKTLGGGFGALCGGGGFILFGLIGGILWLFGRKKPAAA